ncbi:hypothetical protein [Pseudodesulfovibrio sp.]|uniref:hypothetical protein n=1 Tax=unclassified Pseudodesulfovibrio TaxID=2661612 RepID=UPI003AFFE860
MNAFDLLAESKMRQWEQDKKDGKPKRNSAGPVIGSGSGESFERQLFADIKRLIRRSHLEEPAARRQTLREAEDLQVQLSARLERNSSYHLCRYIFETLAALRKECAGD